MTRNLDTTSNDVSARKIAVLIDGDNAESSLVGEFVAETGRFGKVTVKRIYAGKTKSSVTWHSATFPNSNHHCSCFYYGRLDLSTNEIMERST